VSSLTTASRFASTCSCTLRTPTKRPPNTHPTGTTTRVVLWNV